MKGPYLEKHEIDQMNDLLQHALDDTLTCWIGTRLKGHSASMICDGNVSVPLIKVLDQRILPLIKPTTQDEGSGQVVECCVCGAAVDTREEADGGTPFGAQLSSGEWVCSSKCWDLAVTQDEDK